MSDPAAPPTTETAAPKTSAASEPTARHRQEERDEHEHGQDDDQQREHGGLLPGLGQEETRPPERSQTIDTVVDWRTLILSQACLLAELADAAPR